MKKYSILVMFVFCIFTCGICKKVWNIPNGQKVYCADCWAKGLIDKSHFLKK